MKGRYIFCFCVILIIVPLVSAGESGIITAWKVTNVTDYSENGMSEGDPGLYTMIVYGKLSDTSMILGLNLSGNENGNQSILMNGEVFPSRNFFVKGSGGTAYFGSTGDTGHSLLYILPSPGLGGSSFTILNLTYLESEDDDGQKGVVFNSADIINPFMAVVSSEIDEAKRKSQQSDNAWLPGNSLYKDNPAITCKENQCGCEGETCICSGSDCKGEGKDADWSDKGYSCTGFDCLLTCTDGKDCRLETQATAEK
jgi:hypothetical protein